MRSKKLVRTGRHALGAAALTVAACAPADAPPADPLIRYPGADVFAAGSVVTVSDSVAGDAMAVGRSVSYRGFAGGSYLGLAGEQRIEGRVDGSARAVGRIVELSGSIGRNVTAGGGYVLIAREAGIDGNAFVAAGLIEFEGTVAGDLYVAGDDVRLDGEVGGDVRVEARRLTLGPAALIGGELSYRVAEDSPPPDLDAATVGEVETLPPWRLGWLRPIPYAYRLLAFVIAALLVVALFPHASGRAADVLERRPAASAGAGLLWILLGPIAVAVLAATVLGLPLALVVLGLYVASVYLAPIVPAVWVGRELLPGGGQRGGRRPRLTRIAAGALIVGFAILLPWVGFVARIAAVALGLGALVLAVRSARPI